MNPEWRTPKALFDKIDAVFHFDLDVAATAENALCRNYFTKGDDALTRYWKATCFMNPPYSRGELAKWTRKAVEQSTLGAVIVGLIPSVTDTAFWHDYVLHSSAVIFLRGRVKFDGPKAGTPMFGSALVIWTRDYQQPEYDTWDWKRDPLPPQLRSFAEPFAVDNRQQRMQLALP